MRLRALLVASVLVGSAVVGHEAEAGLKCPGGTLEVTRVPCPPASCPVPFPVCVDRSALQNKQRVPLPPPKCAFPKVPVFRGGWSCVKV